MEFGETVREHLSERNAADEEKIRDRGGRRGLVAGGARIIRRRGEEDRSRDASCRGRGR